MHKRRSVAFIIITALILSFSGCTSVEKNSETYTEEIQQKDVKDTFPNKPIQIVVPYAPGGGTDAVARALADSAKKYFSQPILVVNKTGNGGAVAISEGASSQPDGYTLTMITVELTTLPNVGIAPFTYQDFKPIVQVNADPGALTVKTDAPWNNVKEFIEYARNNLGNVKVGNSGEGAIWHLAALGIENKTGVKFNHVFFDGAAPAVVSLLGGEIDAVITSPPEVLTHVKNGQLKVLGVLSSDCIDILPTVKTFIEQDCDFVIRTWRGLGVPKDTPDSVVKSLEEGFRKAAEDPDFKQIMKRLELGYMVAGPKEFSQTIKESDDLFKKLIKDLHQ